MNCAPLILLCVSAAAAPLLGADEPRIAVDRPVFRFGQRDAAETVTNRFILRNTGTAPLVVSAVRTSCGCTHAEPRQRRLAPGQQTELDVRLTLRGLNGRQRKSVSIVSNDPATPVLTLWMEGESRQAIYLVPPAVSFNGPDRQPVTVRLAGYATNVTATAAVPDDPAFRVTVAEDGRSLTFDPPQFAAPGAHRARTDITLSDPARGPLTLHLYAWQDEPPRANPEK
jgi:hypothetical protein